MKVSLFLAGPKPSACSQSSTFAVSFPGRLKLRSSRGLLATIVFLSCMAGTLHAQTVTGTLLGAVTDSTGAVVPNVKIIATQADAGVTRETTSNESGNFTMPNLPPGTYTLTALLQGFKKEAHQNIVVLTNSTDRVDITLATGNVTETVMVTATQAMLQTDRADISTKIVAREIADLPIGTNRNFQALLNLVPGMAPAVFQHSQFFNAQSSLQTEANGLPRQGIFIRSKASTTMSEQGYYSSLFLRLTQSRRSTFQRTILRRNWAEQPAP